MYIIAFLRADKLLDFINIYVKGCAASSLKHSSFSSKSNPVRLDWTLSFGMSSLGHLLGHDVHESNDRSMGGDILDEICWDYEVDFPFPDPQIFHFNTLIFTIYHSYVV